MGGRGRERLAGKYQVAIVRVCGQWEPGHVATNLRGLSLVLGLCRDCRVVVLCLCTRMPVPRMMGARFVPINVVEENGVCSLGVVSLKVGELK